MNGGISLIGVKTHNLKNISLHIPHGKITCITGVSGSGKSSLAFDTIYAEGQHRYIETLDHKIKMKIKGGKRAELDDINGISPAVAVSQKIPNYGKTTTLASLLDLTDYLKLLFIHASETICPVCDIKLKTYEPGDIFKEISSSFKEGDKFTVSAPFNRILDSTMKRELLKRGFTRVIINNEKTDIDFVDKLPKHENFSVIVDRIKFKSSASSRIIDSLELAYKLTDGKVEIEKSDGNKKQYFKQAICPICNYHAPVADMKMFSASALTGICPSCGGNSETNEVCDECGGSGIALHVKSRIFNKKNILEILSFTASEAKLFFEKTRKQNKLPYLSKLSEPILNRLKMLSDFAPHLKLNTIVSELSDGEIRILQIIKHTASPLGRIIYILDEPSQSITASEKTFLKKLIFKLKERENTVILVEHDLDLIKIADYIIELGAEAGEKGGYIIFKGTYDDLIKCKNSPTADYINGNIVFPAPYSKNFESKIIFGLKNINFRKIKGDFSFPYNEWTVIEGAVASGKSSLLYALNQKFSSAKNGANLIATVFGKDLFKGGIYAVDFINIPQNPYSFVASYIGIWNAIRDIFASLPVSKVRGYTSSRFSFKNKEGRCMYCKGTGTETVELGFVSKLELSCSKCNGSGFNPSTMEISYKNKNIFDILNLTADEAAKFFSFHETIAGKLEVLRETGLGYLKLGQKTGSLSGGEAQRLKLGKFLTLKRKYPSLYIMDEPAKGLHPADMIKFCELVQSLLSVGHTVITADHTGILKQSANNVITLR